MKTLQSQKGLGEVRIFRVTKPFYCEGFTYPNCLLPRKTVLEKPFFTAPQI